MFKKAVMMAIKILVSLLPLNFRTWLKRNPKLTSLYSRSLQRSGLFYGFPSPNKLQELYIQLVELQHFKINKLLVQHHACHEVDVFLVITKSSKLASKSIKSLSANRLIRFVFLIGEVSVALRMITLSERNLKVHKLKLLDSFVFDEKRLVLLLRDGDLIHESFVAVYSNEFTKQTNESTLMYCDIDFIDEVGKRQRPELLPSWDPDLQLSTGYIKTAVVLRGEQLISSFTGFAAQGSVEYIIPNWLIFLYFNQDDVNIHHIPYVLLHQTIITEFDWRLNKLKLNSAICKVNHSSFRGVHSLEWSSRTSPLVTLIIPTKNARNLVENCLNSILVNTTYENYEILLIDNNSDDLASIEYFQQVNTLPKVRVLKYPYSFNYSAINNFAVKHARGEVIGLINNDVEVITSNWLALMVGHVLRQDIGCVGAKLLYPDGRIQHAGVVMGYGGGAGHAHKYFPRYHPGYMNRLAATNNYCAVTAACLLVKRGDYEAVGGLNENLAVAFNDVDFCLKVRELGRRNLYCAEAELFHHESVSRGFEDTIEKQTRFFNELEYLKKKWSSLMADDPCYNQNLTLKRENFSIKQIDEF